MKVSISVKMLTNLKKWGKIRKNRKKIHLIFIFSWNFLFASTNMADFHYVNLKTGEKNLDVALWLLPLLLSLCYLTYIYQSQFTLTCPFLFLMFVSSISVKKRKLGRELLVEFCWWSWKKLQEFRWDDFSPRYII